ncbi:MAG: deaminase, partial [Pseudonocardia sp.]|nr:deaminase [Pseudonocardia sp.]
GTMSSGGAPGLPGHDQKIGSGPVAHRPEVAMTATYTFDVFSSLDGYGSYGGNGDWGGYWGKQGPELLDHRLA